MVLPSNSLSNVCKVKWEIEFMVLHQNKGGKESQKEGL